ncbi:MAG: trypsin-like peptidase domain-containing protein [Candidatus Taylorbacteria bacterium]|nr:trypsin-like peptidase domain-containing protein [Candidatus Taylorbacteria bacterium]
MIHTPSQKVTVLTGLASGFIGAGLFFAFVFATGVGPIFENRGARTAQNASQIAAPMSYRTALSQEKAIIDVVKKAEPAVLSIVVAKEVAAGVPNTGIDEDFFDLPFEFRLPKRYSPESGGKVREEVGNGSAFLISPDGLAVTNKHVVEDTEATLTAINNDGKKYGVTVVAIDPLLDIAVIRLKNAGTDLPYLNIDPNDPAVGSTAIAIGNALGEFQNTVSVGVISGLARSLVASDPFGGVENLDEVIQTDAAINPGNSGGPLLNIDGKVVGINVALADGGQSVGFAIPGSAVYSVIDSVQKTGRIVRPYLGVRYVPITTEVKTEQGLDADYGVLVKSGLEDEPAVLKGSPADKAGIKAGDIILDIDGNKLDKDRSLAKMIRDRKVGDTVTLKVLRDGKERGMKAKLEELKN